MQTAEKAEDKLMDPKHNKGKEINQYYFREVIYLPPKCQNISVRKLCKIGQEWERIEIPTHKGCVET